MYTRVESNLKESDLVNQPTIAHNFDRPIINFNVSKAGGELFSGS